jgi:phytoene dehydrogenase-like protein/ferredoxin-NADP reductase
MRNDWDAIIVGSGMGALSAASILAQMNKKRVLVLERHFEIGGFTHSFRRKGYSWDVGLHYVGEMSADTMIRRLFDYVTAGKLKWEKMPENFEKFVYPGFVFEVPSDPIEYRKRLVAAFPHEQRAIAKYFRDIRAARRWYIRETMTRFLPQPLAWGIRTANRAMGKAPRITTAEYLRSHISDERLRTVLTSQWLDYGMPPEQSAFAVHALIVSHYLHGGYYPHGGAERIARIVEEIVEEHGGTFLINCEVTGIITRGNRAEGVRVRHLPQGEPAEYYAPVVISDTGAVNTFDRLLAGNRNPRIRSKAAEFDRLDKGLSAVILFLGLKSSPQCLDVQGENWWINETMDCNAARTYTERLMAGIPLNAYISFPSMKAGDDRPATAEIISIVDPSIFAQWRGQPWRKRAPEYYALKDRLAESLLALVERHISGFGELVAYKELATPLTIEHFSGRAWGRMYGLADIPEKFESTALRAKTPIHGLYLTGSDVSSLGIAGALMGGVSTASRMNGSLGFFRIMRQVGGNATNKGAIRELDQPATNGVRRSQAQKALPGQKLCAVLVEKVPLTETVFELVFELPLAIAFEPGQYARVSVGNHHWRDYSIVDLCGNQVSFLIDTRFVGIGSRFVASLAPGERTFMRLPVGDFKIADSDCPHCFIATGTGISPFIPMIKSLLGQERPPSIELLFGCRFQRDALLTDKIIPPPGTPGIGITVCVSRETPSVGMEPGRVTDLLRAKNFDLEDTQFYLCGNPSMIAETTALLMKRGAKNIFREDY